MTSPEGGADDGRAPAPPPGELAPAAVRGRVLVAAAETWGPLLRLAAPLSLWGGVDPRTGRVSDPRHPDHGACVTDAVLAIPDAIGSSSSSAIMLELLREGTAPAAVVLGRADAILALGVVVAAELGHEPIPVVEADWAAVVALPAGTVRVRPDGTLVPAGG